MTTIDGAIIKVALFYSSESTETIVRPQDVCDSHKTYIISTKECDTKIGEGLLTFCSKTGISKANIPFIQYDRLWFLIKNTQTTTINNKMSTVPEDAIYSILLIVLHDLWHNYLCYSSHNVTKDIHKHCEGVPYL